MPNITLLSTDIRPNSGWGTVTYELCEAFSRNPNFNFQVLLPKIKQPLPKLPFFNSVKFLLPPWISSFKSCPWKIIPFVFSRVDIGETDLIHAIVEFPYAILAWRLAQKHRIPFVLSIHGTYGVEPFLKTMNRILYKKAFRHAAAITSPSNFTAQTAQQVSNLKREFKIIGNPIDYSRFQKASNGIEIRNRYGIPKHSQIVLSVGAIKPRKGFDLLIKAFGEISKHFTDVVLVIIGVGNPQPLYRLAESLELKDRVYCLGEVTNEDLVAFYQMCEIFALLPRRDQWHFEGFGIVYLEAGACGKPVIGSRSAGVPEAVKHEKTGLLVEEENFRDASVALGRLLSDKNFALALGNEGRKWAQSHDRELFGNRVMDIYEEVLRKPI